MGVCVSLCTREIVKSREQECKRNSNVRTRKGEEKMCVTKCVCEGERRRERERVKEKNEVLRDWIRNRLSITEFLLHREHKQAPC